MPSRERRPNIYMGREYNGGYSRPTLHKIQKRYIVYVTHLHTYHMGGVKIMATVSTKHQYLRSITTLAWLRPFNSN